MRLNTLIFEDFFDDPYKVRNEALQQDFYPPFYLKDIPKAEGLDSDLVYWISQIGYFSGKRTIHAKVNMPEIQKFTEDRVKRICNLPFEQDIQCYFTYQIKGDETDNNIHQDRDPILAGVIYLTPNPILGSGTYFYRHKETEFTGLNSTEYPESAFKDMHPYNRSDQDISKFEEFGYVENVWNRLVLYDSNVLHKSGKYFGTNLQTGRLTLTFFVYKTGE